MSPYPCGQRDKAEQFCVWGESIPGLDQHDDSSTRLEPLAHHFWF
ncbi:unnamed protein product [Arabidopsis halleri]